MIEKEIESISNNNESMIARKAKEKEDLEKKTRYLTKELTKVLEEKMLAIETRDLYEQSLLVETARIAKYEAYHTALQQVLEDISLTK
jgi:hypothetical protein